GRDRRKPRREGTDVTEPGRAVPVGDVASARPGAGTARPTAPHSPRVTSRSDHRPRPGPARPIDLAPGGPAGGSVAMMLMILHVLGPRPARLLARPTRLDTFTHLLIIVLGTLLSAHLAGVGTGHAGEAHHRALAGHQFRGEGAELLAVHRQLGRLGVL